MTGYLVSGVLFLLLSIAVTAGLHFHYVRHSYASIPKATHAFILVSLWVCLIPFPLLILDANSGLAATRAGLTENPDDGFFNAWWWLIMVMTQIMSWVILPIAQAYDEAGGFTPGARFRTSLAENIKMYIIMGVVVAILMGYIAYVKGLQTPTDVVHMVIAAANAFGLLLLVIFLSVGLVAVPRGLWRQADYAYLARANYSLAVDISEALEMAKMDLADLRAALAGMDPRVDDEKRVHLMIVLEKIDTIAKVIPLTQTTSSRARLAEGAAASDEVTLAALVQLNTDVNRQVKLVRRLHFQWTRMHAECVTYEAVLSGGEGAAAGAHGAPTSALSLWMTVRRPVYQLLAVVTGVMTLLVLWSEAVLPFQSVNGELSIIEHIMKTESLSFVGSIGFLFYIAAVCYYATFQFKVFDVYQVLPGYSDAASLCFTTTFLTRLILPLCYNFLWMADLTGNPLVSYSNIFGKMDIVSFLGKWFNRFIPIFIPILVVLIETTVVDKFLSYMGVERHDVGNLADATVRQRVSDGKVLLLGTARELPVAGAAAGVTTAAAGENNAGAAAAPAAERGKRYAEWKAKRAAEEAEGK